MIDSSYNPPPAPVMPPPLSPAPGSQQAEPRGRRWSTAIGVLAVLAGLVALIMLYLDAAGERDDNADALASKRSELASVQSEVDDLEGDVDDLQSEVDQLSSAIADRDGELAAAKASLASIGADLDDAAAMLTDAETERDEAIEGLVTALSVSLQDGDAFTAVEADCIAADVTEQYGPDAMTNLVLAGADEIGYSAANELYDAFEAAADTCGVEIPDVPIDDLPVSDLGVEQGIRYGDNPVLDRFQDACAAGDGLACDDLYVSSAYGTEYERFGVTCGDRFYGDDIPELCDGSI